MFALIKKVLLWLILLIAVYEGGKFWLTMRFAGMISACPDSATMDAMERNNATREEKARYAKQAWQCVREQQNWLDRWVYPGNDNWLK